MFALYIHWPFCKKKCPYCDFNSHIFNHIDYRKWEAGYLKELEHFSFILERHTITSIFFGGGTPSLMPPYLVESILNSIKKQFKTAPDIEITLEANPTSVEVSTFADLYQAGINRFSIGIQSLNSDDLVFLGREHSAGDAINALEQVAKITPNYSFDLIYNRPNQTVESWSKELGEALSLASNHLSLYQLTIEKGTPFYKAYHDGEFTLPDDETAADLYDITQHMMNEHQLYAYEISNHAKPGHECKHNLNYWLYDEYLGIGPGAHSRVTIDDHLSEMIMIYNPGMWLKKIHDNQRAIQKTTPLSYQETFEEFVMMGLRLDQGISQERCKHKFGNSFDERFDPDILSYLKDQELLIIDDNIVKTTKNGKKVLNHIIERLFT
ncbi:MAG: radical SAM family heme chaperone HemW [Rickettsiales bacterium]|nr:radical SAM family heme chaperone HemW [Rickettsiales bacterium]